MAENSKIEWTDATFNPWIGCTKVGPGCDHCYAAAQDSFRKWTPEGWGPGNPRKRTSPANWRKPLQWNEESGRGRFVRCAGCGQREFRKFDNTFPPGGLACCSKPDCLALPESESDPVRPRVFCASLADWLDNEVPIEWLVDLLDLIRTTPNLDWLLLSKRIGNWKGRLALAAYELRRDFDWARTDDSRKETLRWIDDWLHGNPPANVWLGATVVNQAEADRDIPKLLQVNVRVRWLSMEPLLGPVRLDRVMRDSPDGDWTYCDDVLTGFRANKCGGHFGEKIDWVVVGGESGSNARPMHPDWARSIQDQCQSAGVAFLFKQWGEWLPSDHFTPELNAIDPDYGRWAFADYEDGEWVIYADPGDESMWRVGKRRAGRLLDGRTWDQFPETAHG